MNIESLEYEIKELEREKNEVTILLKSENIDELKKSLLIDKYINIKQQLDIKRKNLYDALVNSRQPDLSDNEIDLYKSVNNEEINYIIKLNKNDECIGFIDYRKESVDTLGNIGYGIKPACRGNNYALKALNLVALDLLNEGVEDLIITAFKDNIPSIKTIENFGGILIDIKDDILIYKCKLNKKRVIK